MMLGLKRAKNPWGQSKFGNLRLWLGNIDDGTAHAANEDHAALGFPCHLPFEVD